MLSSKGGERYVDLPPRPLQKISQELGEPKASAEGALFDYCEKQPAIQSLLREFKVSRQDFQELYRQLIMVGAGQWACGHWVAASSLAYPESLRYLLSRKGENIQETAYNLIMFFERGPALQT